MKWNKREKDILGKIILRILIKWNTMSIYFLKTKKHEIEGILFLSAKIFVLSW